MDKKELQAIAQAAAKNIKTEADLNEFRQMLTKITCQRQLKTDPLSGLNGNLKLTHLDYFVTACGGTIPAFFLSFSRQLSPAI